MKAGATPTLRLIEGGRDRQGPARPESLAMAVELARAEIAAMMANIMPDSQITK